MLGEQKRSRGQRERPGPGRQRKRTSENSPGTYLQTGNALALSHERPSRQAAQPAQACRPPARPSQAVLTF